jgi:hypothetical protein
LKTEREKGRRWLQRAWRQRRVEVASVKIVSVCSHCNLTPTSMLTVIMRSRSVRENSAVRSASTGAVNLLAGPGRHGRRRWGGGCLAELTAQGRCLGFDAAAPLSAAQPQGLAAVAHKDGNSAPKLTSRRTARSLSAGKCSWQRGLCPHDTPHRCIILVRSLSLPPSTLSAGSEAAAAMNLGHYIRQGWGRAGLCAGPSCPCSIKGE